MSKAPECIAREGGVSLLGDSLLCVPEWVRRGNATVLKACQQGQAGSGCRCPDASHCEQTGGRWAVPSKGTHSSSPIHSSREHLLSTPYLQDSEVGTEGHSTVKQIGLFLTSWEWVPFKRKEGIQTYQVRRK